MQVLGDFGLCRREEGISDLQRKVEFVLQEPADRTFTE
jgi:hypothetical protein